VEIPDYGVILPVEKGIPILGVELMPRRSYPECRLRASRRRIGPENSNVVLRFFVRR
jgi:hypothetical protein